MRSSGRLHTGLPRGALAPLSVCTDTCQGRPGTLRTLTPTQASLAQAAQKVAPHVSARERLPEEKPHKCTGDHLTPGLFCLTVHTQGCLLGAGVGKERSKRHVHTHAHSHMYAHMQHTHTHSHMHHSHMHIQRYTCKHIQVHTQTQAHTDMHMQTHAHGHPLSHTLTLTCTHTDIHRQAHTVTWAHTHRHSHTLMLTCTHADTLMHTHAHRHSLTHPGDMMDAGHVSARAGMCALTAWPCAAPGRAGTCHCVARLLLDGRV